VPDCARRWRKEVVTDRQHRHRAQLCIPPGLRRCAVCGSTRFLVVDHIDADESNDSPENLRWLCKADNTRLGFAAARAGKGQRVCQFNPGAETLREYVEAAMAHRRGEHDQGGAIIHATPVDQRKTFAKEIWKRRRAHGRQTKTTPHQRGRVTTSD
jgi:hypothetical protein